MNVIITVASVIKQATKALDDGARNGTRAAGQVVANEVKRRLAGGYTSGAFVTGHHMRSVRVSKPFRTALREWGVRVGTDVKDYPMAWELGHQNLYTGRYERVPVYVPSAIETKNEQRSAYNRQIILSLRRVQKPVPKVL